MAGPGGDALRRRIDEMSNEEYQALIRLRDGAELRTRLTDVADAEFRRRSARHRSTDMPTRSCVTLIANLGGHDLPALLDVLHQADAVTTRPSVDLRLHHQGLRAADGRRPAQPLAAADARRRWTSCQPSLGDAPDDAWAALPDPIAGGRELLPRGGRATAPTTALSPRRSLATDVPEPDSTRAIRATDLDPGGARPRPDPPGGVAEVASGS